MDLNIKSNVCHYIKSEFDQNAECNLCIKPVEELKEIFIKDLKIEQIEPDTIMWVYLITNPSQVGLSDLIFMV